MILTERTKLLDSNLIKASFGGRFFSLSRKNDILQETVKNQTNKNQVDNPHKQKMHHALWQKLFSLSLKPKEPISGDRFGVTPPWWGLFSLNWKPIQLFIENFRKKRNEVKLLFSENVLPYLLKTAKDLFTHSRDKHIFNQYFEKQTKKRQTLKTLFTWSETNQN